MARRDASPCRPGPSPCRRGASGQSCPCALALAPLALVALLAQLGIPCPAAGQDIEGAAISGLVVEATTGRPLPLARAQLVAVAASDPEASAGQVAVTRSSWTDGEGRYRFDALPPGMYRLTVSRLGYRTATLWVSTPAPAPVRRSVGLEIEPVRLEAVQVRGLPVAGPGRLDPTSAALRDVTPPRSHSIHGTGTASLDAHTLTRDQVRARSTLGEPDVLRALQRLPGVSSRGDVSTELWTRGAPWGMTRILLDGLPLYDPLHMGGSFSSLAAEGIQAATLLPGVRPAPLADGAAGTLSLESRQAGSESERGLSASPLAVRAHVDERRLDGRMGFVLTARRSWWDWLDPPKAFTGSVSSGGIDYHFSDFTARLDARVPGEVLLEAGGLVARDRLTGDIAGVVAESRGRWESRTGWVALARRWNDGELGVRAFVGRSGVSSWTRSEPWRSFFTRDGVPVLDWMDLDLAHTLTRVEVDGRRPQGGLTWAVGLDRVREALEQTGIQAWDLGAPGTRGPAALEWSRPWGQLDLEGRRLGLSTGLAWSLSHGTRVPELGPLANARFRLSPHPRLRLEAAWGQSLQTAYPLARAGRSVGPALGMGHIWILAGEETPPLSAQTGTLAAQAALPQAFRLEAAFWRRQVTGLAMEGVLTLREGEVAPAAQGEPEGREAGRGYELSLRRESTRVRGAVSLARTRSLLRGPEGDVWISPAQRRHSVNGHVSSELGAGLRGAVFVTWESGWSYTLGPWACAEPEACPVPLGDPLRPTTHDFRRAPGFRSVDVVLDWERRAGGVSWGASVSVQNLMGWRNVSAHRPLGCTGRTLISVVCNPVGEGRFASGLGGPTPSIALRARF